MNSIYETSNTDNTKSLEVYVTSLEEQNTRLKAENEALRRSLNEKNDLIEPDDSEQLKCAIKTFYNEKLLKKLINLKDVDNMSAQKQLDQIFIQLDRFIVTNNRIPTQRQISNASPPFTFAQKNQELEGSFHLKMEKLHSSEAENTHTSHRIYQDHCILKKPNYMVKSLSSNPVHTNRLSEIKCLKAVDVEKGNKYHSDVLYCRRSKT